MVGRCSEWFWSRKKCHTVLVLLLAICTIPTSPLFSQPVAAEEGQAGAANQLALAPDESKPKTAKPVDEKSEPERPPEVEILSTVKNGGGYGQELHRVSITGIARNAAGDPIKDADIYVASSARMTPGNFERLRGHTKSDEFGFFEVQDIQLLVVRQRANPIPKPVEGKFTVFGTKEGYGFTWHPSRLYRPDTRPQGTENGDKNEQVTARAFYLNEPIVVDLIFERDAKLKGRITDKQGKPLANAKVQVGLIDNLRVRNQWGTWSCRFLGNENHPVDDSGFFDSILSLPTEFRETRTDKNGFYEFTQLRRDTSYLANIDPGPTFDPWHFRLATAPENKVRRGIIAVGYDGEFNREFEMPRNVTVQVVQEKTEQPISNVQITALPVGQIRRAGIQARSDSQGNARLQLLPGEYKLIAEPAPDLPFYFQSEQFIVSDKSGAIQHTVKLRPAAIVILKAVNAETGEPIPGVRFNYETHDTSKQLPVSTQSVFVDYPETNAAGEIQAFMVPGMRRFVVTEPLSLAQADGSRGERVKLSAGKLTEVEFKLTPPQFLPAHLADQTPKPDPDSIYPPDLQLKWHTQSELLRLSHLRVNIDMILVSRKPVDTEALMKDLRSLDPYQLPDIDKLLKKHQAGDSYRCNAILTSSGKLRSETRYNQARNPRFFREDKTRLPDSATFTDQWDTLQYSTANNQASVSRRGGSGAYMHIASSQEFSDWPSLRVQRPPSSPRKKPAVKIRQEGRRTIYDRKTEKYTHRRVFDQETGFIFENYLEHAGYESQRVSMFFAPQKHANGLILPRLFIDWRRSKGKLGLLKVYEIKAVEVFTQLPADAFAIPLPSGALIVDSRHIPPRASRSGPVRHIQTTMRGPVSDFAAYLQRHPQYSHQVEQKIHYGRRAPEIKPAKWVTSKGESEAPDLKGKVVLVEFWGTRCGPCIAQLPEVRTAARYYADHPFVLIGIHDSHISVSDLQKFAEQEDLQYQLAIDRPATEKGWFGQTMRDFGIRGIPQSAVIDQQGNVAFVGGFEESLRTVDRLLK
ncbi:redoxin domain-containing protein [uncultured Gimesia sp.]|uniref:TlpA family protein disulfide reductase n=1 Tax=uncultured Gimesia sp. TaxID=1678688 RepID=UPI0030D83B3A|tara:strand:+ start:19253 stop:22345 length:3093 start_codon:yes stop_codon:yes gene_type:complete